MYECNINKLLEAVEQFCDTIYRATEIFIANPFDLIEIDMSKIPSNCYFISNHNINRGTFLKANNDEFKRTLYEFIEANPDRVFRGKR